MRNAALDSLLPAAGSNRSVLRGANGTDTPLLRLGSEGCYAGRREVGGPGSVLRLIFEPSSPQGSSHNPQFTVARRLAVTNGT